MLELYKNQFNILSQIFKVLFQPWATVFGYNTKKDNPPIIIIMPVFFKPF